MAIECDGNGQIRLDVIVDEVNLKMDTIIYDADGNGTVDDAELANGHTVEADVPAGALFTDTVYNDSALQAEVDDKEPDLGNPSVNGRILSSTTTGTRSWIDPPEGGTPSDGGVPIGGIILWEGSVSALPSGYAVCNGGSGTPDLRDRFVMGTASDSDMGDMGGSADSTLVQHTHDLSDHKHNAWHTHGATTAYFYASQYRTVYHDSSVGGSLSIGSGWSGQLFSGDGLTAGAQNGITMDLYGENTVNVVAEDFMTGSPESDITSQEGSSASGTNNPPYYKLAYIQRIS